MPEQENITQLLLDIKDADDAAVQALFPLVYEQMKRMARGHLARNRPGETLNTTALVHEAYARLVDQTVLSWQSRAHFFSIASRAMRFIIVDYVRERLAAKRGGGVAKLDIAEVQIAGTTRSEELLMLDEALTRLGQLDERLSQLVEYHFFGGLAFKEIAEITQRSERTIRRDWVKAKLLLKQEMQVMRES